jgi:hypothetical protein
MYIPRSYLPLSPLRPSVPSAGLCPLYVHLSSLRVSVPSTSQWPLCGSLSPLSLCPLCGSLSSLRPSVPSTCYASLSDRIPLKMCLTHGRRRDNGTKRWQFCTVSHSTYINRGIQWGHAFRQKLRLHPPPPPPTPPFPWSGGGTR